MYRRVASTANSWLRGLTRDLPSGAASRTSSTYYNDAEQLGQAVCDLPATAPQFGMLKQVTGPTPAAGGAVSTQFAYDLWGRTVGSFTSGDSAWSCVSFDSRGRPVTSTIPAGATPARNCLH